MPRRALPSDHAPIRAPRKKRLAAGKIASSPARKRTKAKTKASQYVATQPLLQLPAPRPIPLLTYVGPSQQIGSSAIAIDLPRPTEKPSAPRCRSTFSARFPITPRRCRRPRRMAARSRPSKSCTYMSPRRASSSTSRRRRSTCPNTQTNVARRTPRIRRCRPFVRRGAGLDGSH
jgi:hypothetical protein